MAGSSKKLVPLLTQILKTVSEGGLDKALQGCKVVSASPGQCIVSMVVKEEHMNRAGTMHGGFSAHLVDSISTLALLTVGDDPRPGVSVDMNMTYMKPAALGEEIFVEAKTLRSGKTLAFLECEIRNQKQQLLVKGSHTKYVG